MKCKIKYATIPILNVRQLKQAIREPARGRGRGRGRRISLKVKKTLQKQIVWKRWPILCPSTLAAEFIPSGNGDRFEPPGCIGLNVGVSC